MRNKLTKNGIKKKTQVLKGVANTLIYGTPLGTLLGMGVRIYVEDTPQLTFMDNFTFQFSFWAIITGLIIVPVYLKIFRKRIRDARLIQESRDGYIAPKYRLLQTANYGVSIGLLVALVFVFRLLASDEMLMFLGISGTSGLIGNVMLTIDSVNKQTNKELKELENQ
jgi:hypothetical protein